MSDNLKKTTVADAKKHKQQQQSNNNKLTPLFTCRGTDRRLFSFTAALPQRFSAGMETISRRHMYFTLYRMIWTTEKSTFEVTVDSYSMF